MTGTDYRSNVPRTSISVLRMERFSRIDRLSFGNGDHTAPMYLITGG